MGRSLSAFNGPGLTPKQEAVALALASGRSLQETASEVGIGETTVKRWLRNPTVAQRVRELRTDLTSRAAGVLAVAMTDAARTLRYLCRSGKTESTRLKAAEALLNHGNQLNGLKELETRMNEFEAGQPRRRIA